MLKEQYINLKKEYENYLILLKSGNFYISLNNDAFVMNNIFGYKIIDNNNYIKIGFPVTSLNKVVTKLDGLEINYLIFDKEILEKIKHNSNKYKNYIITNNYSVFLNRINKINQILKGNITNPNIEAILTNIESMLCTINY